MNIPDNVLNAISKATIGDGTGEYPEFENADNFRAYKLGDHKGALEFEKIRDNGCCGSFETQAVIDGEVWYLGFNYGH